MRRKWVFLAAVSDDLIEGFNYYETFSPGRGGERFEAAFKCALREIENGVITHFQPFRTFHRVCVPNYPYSLDYRLMRDTVVITALLYARLDPRRIQQNLGQR